MLKLINFVDLNTFKKNAMVAIVTRAKATLPVGKTGRIEAFIRPLITVPYRSNPTTSLF